MNVRGGVDLSLVTPDKMPGIEEIPGIGGSGVCRLSGGESVLSTGVLWLDQYLGISLLTLRDRD